MTFFDAYDLAELRADQRDAGDDLVTIMHWGSRPNDLGGAPASTEPTTYTNVTVRRGSRTARSAPAPALDETQEQSAGGTRLSLPVLQPLKANVSVPDLIAVGDEVRFGSRRYTVIDAPTRRTTDIYRAVLIEELR